MHAKLGKNWHKEDADNEKEALTNEKSDRKTCYELRNKYYEQFKAKLKELNVKIFNWKEMRNKLISELEILKGKHDDFRQKYHA